MLLNESDARSLTDKILSYAASASDASAGVNSDKNSNLRFAGNNLLTSGSRVSRSANVTLWIDGKRGSASTNDLDDDARRVAAVQRAAPSAHAAWRRLADELLDWPDDVDSLLRTYVTANAHAFS